MKVLIFYFSGTGNTWWVVREFAHILAEFGHEASFSSIEKVMSAEYLKRIDDYDLVGFGYPIYGANLPPIFRRFGDNLAQVRKGQPLKKCFTLSTMGYVNAFGPLEAARYFKTAQFKLIGSLNLRLSNNASTPHFKTKVLNDDKLDPLKARVRERLWKFARRIGTGHSMISGIGPYLLPGYLIRRISQREMNHSNEILSIDPHRCFGCHLCAERCPAGSIILKPERREFKSACTLCLRCYNNCPTQAILHMGKWADPKVYIRYRGPEKEWYRRMVEDSGKVHGAKDKNP